MDVEAINDAPEVLMTHLCCKVLQNPVVADAMFLAELQVKVYIKSIVLLRKRRKRRAASVQLSQVDCNTKMRARVLWQTGICQCSPSSKTLILFDCRTVRPGG